MKLKIITTAALVATISLIAPVKAQNSEPGGVVTPSEPAQVSADQVLQACAQDRAETLPNPYTDIPPDHWALKAVLSMHYCGAYRGSISPEKAKPLLEQQQNPQQSSTNILPTS